MKAHARAQLAAGAMVCGERTAGNFGRMDTMEVNKGIAAVLVVGIVFFLTGLIGDKLVYETPPSKPALEIKGGGGAPAETEAAEPAPLPPVSPLLATADVAAGEALCQTGLRRLPHLQRGRQADRRPEPLWRGRRAARPRGGVQLLAGHGEVQRPALDL